MIDKATIAKIKERADIVEVVSDYVHLTRRGANYMGLCPFHNERTPSFSVNKRKNFCYCFSCHKGGSPVNFIMEKEGVSYHDALIHLANKYGIKVEERELSEEEKRLQSEREAMLVANEWAMTVFEKNLTSTEEGRNIGLQYFYQRGVTDEAIRKFRLGYALDNSNALIAEARKSGFDINVLKQVGLVGESKEGRLYDRFRGRVIYPVLNSAGKVIAFGGRDLKGGPAKYINSPESAIYKKSNELYGIYQAKNEISRDGICFLVEGYMDVIGMWQSGMENVLASSGTALTEGQIALIHRFAEEVTLIYDGDAAGIKASLRGIDMLLAQKLRLKILLLPDGDDPDSFARKHTPEEFRKFVEDNAVDVIRFKTQVLMKDSANDPVKRSQAIHSIVQSIASIPDKIQRITYIQECAARLNVSEDIIAAETEKARVKILEQWRLERERKHIEKDFPTSSASASVSPLPQTNNSTPTTSTQQAASAQQTPTVASPFEPYEREVIRYCLKYGLITLCDGVDEEGNNYPMSVMEYIAGELAYDNVEFSVPHYAQIFDLISSMQEDFNSDFISFRDNLLLEIDEERRKGYDDIRNRDLSTRQIDIEEKRLQERLEAMQEEAIREYSISYPGRILASHEDDNIRKTVTSLITDKVILSRRFRKGRPGESEFDRLAELLPRALTEWKDGILRHKYQIVKQQLDRAAAEGNHELADKLAQEAFEIMQIRKEAAKNIGERILAAKR